MNIPRKFALYSVVKPWNLLFCKRLMFDFLSYSRSSPCDHSRKQSGLVYTTTFVKTRLNCDLNFAMKSLGKWLLREPPWPLLGESNFWLRVEGTISRVHFFKRNFHEEHQTPKSSVLITADTECWQMHCNKSALVRETSLTFRRYLRKYTKVGLVSNKHQTSLRKHPFLLALRRLGRFTRRNVCNSVAKIPYWWRNSMFT